MAGAMRATKVLVVGDAFIDCDVFYKSDRKTTDGIPIITEPPGCDRRGGGSLNVLRVLDSLTVNPELFCDQLESYGFQKPIGYINRVHELTGESQHKTREFIDLKQYSRHDTPGVRGEPSKQDERLETLLSSVLPHPREQPEYIVVVSDYDKGAVTPTTIEILRDFLLNAVIIVDAAATADNGKYRGADAIFRNGYTAQPCENQILVRHTPIGCELFGCGGEGEFNGRWPSYAWAVNDTCGAGDTLIAATAAALAAGESWTEAVTIACVAAAIKVERPWRDWRAPTWVEIGGRREQLRAANLAAWTRQGELSRSTAVSTACTGDT